MDVKMFILALVAVIVAFTLLGMALILLIKHIQLFQVPESSVIPNKSSGDAFLYSLYIQNANADSYKKMFNCFAGATIELFNEHNIDVDKNNKLIIYNPPEDREFCGEVYDELVEIRGIMEQTDNDDYIAIGQSMISMLDKARRKYKTRLAIRGFRYNLPPSFQKYSQVEEYAGFRNYLCNHPDDIDETHFPLGVAFGLLPYADIPRLGACLEYIYSCMEKEMKRQAEENAKKAKEKSLNARQKKRRFTLF